MIRRSWTRPASIEETLALWAASLREIKKRIRPLFNQDRVASNAGLFLASLLRDEQRKTGWMRAEAAGDPGPWRPPATPGRLEAAYVPPDAGFATKPKLAKRMIARAIAASVPFKWVAGDTVYGVGDIEQQLRQAGRGYVLGVSSAHVFQSWGKRRSVAGK